MPAPFPGVLALVAVNLGLNHGSDGTESPLRITEASLIEFLATEVQISGDGVLT